MAIAIHIAQIERGEQLIDASGCGAALKPASCAQPAGHCGVMVSEFLDIDPIAEAHLFLMGNAPQDSLKLEAGVGGEHGRDFI